MRAHHVRSVLRLALLAGLPGAVATAVLLFALHADARLFLTVEGAVVAAWLACAFLAREKVERALQTAGNLVASLREGDFSVRAREASADDALGQLLLDLNGLSASLRDGRLAAEESGALFRSVMDGLDVPMLAFTREGTCALWNRAAERAFGGPPRDASSLGLAVALEGPAQQTLNLPGLGPTEVRRGTVRLTGVAHELLVLTDLRRALREEERLAWQRLVRVLGHEINNSLAPIRSISGSLRDAIRDRAPGWEDDVAAGLEVVERRAEALARFLGAYSRLARLPPPSLQEVQVGEWVTRVSRLDARTPVEVAPGPPATVRGDPDQLEQLLINLVKNAIDASLETAGRVRISWDASDMLSVVVEDEGPGISGTANLFVPFFTTKPGGSGIGLALSRQIAEAHHGLLTLENRKDAKGARAVLRLPL